MRHPGSGVGEVRNRQQFRATYWLRITQNSAHTQGVAGLSSSPEANPKRRRDLQKEQTRLDIALAAFELARTEGLANVRVPQIAESVGVSTRTFNNYFPSKEAAIVWPATLRGAQLTSDFADRPSGELLADALVEAVAGLYGPGGQEGLPQGWLDGFRALVAAEPTLQGEYLRTQAAGERALAEAIARRTGAEQDGLQSLVLAGVILAAERAAVRHWSGQSTRSTRLIEVVRTAVALAVGGTALGDITLR
jgi:AcrR family transcriptional regulator